MAGTLTISTLSDGTNSTSATNAIKGSAKAWVVFNSNNTPPTLTGYYNVSSVTKSATGEYYVNFTNAMPNANYAVSAFSAMDNGALIIMNEYNGGSTRDSATTTSVRLIARTTGGAAANRIAMSCTIFGD